MTRRRITDQERATVTLAAMTALEHPDEFLTGLADKLTLAVSTGRAAGLWRAVGVVIAWTIVGPVGFADTGLIIGVLAVAAVLDQPVTRAIIRWVDRHAP